MTHEFLLLSLHQFQYDLPIKKLTSGEYRVGCVQSRCEVLTEQYSENVGIPDTTVLGTHRSNGASERFECLDYSCGVPFLGFLVGILVLWWLFLSVSARLWIIILIRVLLLLLLLMVTCSGGPVASSSSEISMTSTLQFSGRCLSNIWISFI